VTFLAGATANSVVPEMTGVDARNPAAPRGALSYFVARAIEGAASNGGDVTRETLFKSVTQNVSQATNARQRVDLEPRSDKPAVLRKIVFGFAGSAPTVASEPPPADPDRPTAQSDPVRVAVVNGASTSFSTIEKGNAPFVRADAKEGADLVWDVAGSAVVSRGDPIMSQVDGSLLGGVIDRTWAIQQTQRLSLRRALTVRLGDNDKRYTVNDHPALIVEDVRDRYLTVVNIAADGTLQILFPTHGRDPHMGTDQWTFPPVVGAPFGADHVIAVATSRPATELVDWLMTHNSQRDAAMLPAAIAKAVASDTAARIGTVGLYTTP